MYGLKPVPFIWSKAGLIQELNWLQKSPEFRVELTENVPPGLKPALILLALCGG
jgi:hypothetical protein